MLILQSSEDVIGVKPKPRTTDGDPDGKSCMLSEFQLLISTWESISDETSLHIA